MSKVKVFIVGSSGRMGQALEAVFASGDYPKSHQLVGQTSGRNTKELDSITKLGPRTVVIDFSSPELSLEVAKRIKKSQALLLECSTGHSEAQLKELKRELKGKIWALTPNTSVGVYVLGQAAKLASKLLPGEFAFSLWESHHALKKDAPSGTGKLLQSQIEGASKVRRKIPVHSVRGGTEAGHHRIDIHGTFERLAFEHQAQDRRLFAVGALRLAGVLAKMPSKSEAYSTDELWEASQR